MSLINIEKRIVEIENKPFFTDYYQFMNENDETSIYLKIEEVKNIISEIKLKNN